MQYEGIDLLSEWLRVGMEGTNGRIRTNVETKIQFGRQIRSV